MELRKIHIEEKRYRKDIISYGCLLGFGIIAGLIVFLISICVGNYKTSLFEVWDALINPNNNKQVYNIIMLSRLPRLIGAIFVGASLSVAGLVYQEIFANKMASPDLLGVSAGAGVGASISIYCSIGFVLTSFFAFFGGIISVLITIIVSKLFGNSKNRPIALILAGIVVGGMMNALLGFFKYIANDSQLSSITFWLLGGFYNVSYKQLVIAIPIIMAGLMVLTCLRWKIAILRNGDEDAQTHGINVKLVRIITIIVTTIITSSAICISGTIGWIGLAIPNLMRIFAKNDGRKLLFLSMVYGALFTEICDLLARSITNTELPVGIISGILGGVLFIIILLIQKKGPNYYD